MRDMEKLAQDAEALAVKHPDQPSELPQMGEDDNSRYGILNETLPIVGVVFLALVVPGLVGVLVYGLRPPPLAGIELGPNLFGQAAH